MSKIYVASSWRNRFQQAAVTRLRLAGHEVYDFRHPHPGNVGFHWSEIDPAWKSWDAWRYRAALENPIAQSGFKVDSNAMRWADTCLLVLPCGRSAHIEAGWMKGHGRRLFIVLDDNPEPELMYMIADRICLTMDEVIENLSDG